MKDIMYFECRDERLKILNKLLTLLPTAVPNGKCIAMPTDVIEPETALPYVALLDVKLAHPLVCPLNIKPFPNGRSAPEPSAGVLLDSKLVKVYNWLCGAIPENGIEDASKLLPPFLETHDEFVRYLKVLRDEGLIRYMPKPGEGHSWQVALVPEMMRQELEEDEEDTPTMAILVNGVAVPITPEELQLVTKKKIAKALYEEGQSSREIAVPLRARPSNILEWKEYQEGVKLEKRKKPGVVS